MKLITVGTASLNQTPLDWDGNTRRIIEAIEAARKQGVKILCLPELCVTGYGCEDAFLSHGLQKRAVECTRVIAKSCRGIAVSLGLPLLVDGILRNVAALIVDGRIAGFAAKQNLAGEGVYYEPRWFKPWQAGTHSSYRLAGQRVPVGDLLFDLGEVRVGFEICEDGWVLNRPGRNLISHGAQILLNPSASHFAFGKHRVRRKLVFDRLKSTKVIYLYSNLLGCDSGRMIWDGDCFIGASGTLAAESPRLSFKEYVVTSSSVKVPHPRRAKRAGKADPKLIRCKAGFSLINEGKKPSPYIAPLKWEHSSYLKEEEFTRAVILGLFDYLRKSKSHGFVISLSGGVDSSAAACLVRLMLDAALSDLGHQNFVERLSYISTVKDCRDKNEMTAKLLTCVYQRTENSSNETRLAAQAVAHDIGASFLDISVSPLVDDYVKIVEKAMGRTFSWDRDDIALQNIQARVRSPSVWLIANVQRALLLTTSNRSEAAVGYTTMDGDTSGGLSPLGGIDKAFLRKWCRWLEKFEPEGLRKVESLKLVTLMPPTAELRPLGSNQTDEGDLMPYEVLDIIEKRAIRDKLMPLDVYRKVSTELKGSYSSKKIGLWVEKFFRLWAINQWKRERYAPSFHLDDENLDPKTWCRFPILSGGFDVELRELRSVVLKGNRR